MNSRITFFALLFLSAGLLGSAQNKGEVKLTVDKEFKGVLIAGMNLSQVDGDEVYGFNKMGLTAGVGAIIPLWHRFSLSVEVLYDQRGAFRKYAPVPDSVNTTPYYSLKWDYLSAPVMIHFEDRNTWTFGVGFSYGRIISFKEVEHGISKPWNDRPEITYKTKNDFNIIADLRFRIWKHLKFNIRYSYSLAKIRTRWYDPNPGIVSPWERNQYNNVITLRLLYYLNEKYLPDRFKFPKKKKKNSSVTPPTAYL